MDKDKFNTFFKNYSQNVDNANKHGFWKLSDALITQIIKNNIPSSITKDTIILDAGGGTGRWICNLSEVYKFNKFIVYDLSEDMLKQAKININNKKISNRTELIKGDLIDMSKIESDSIDYIISIYNPISFVYEEKKAFSELFRILKKEGKLILMGQGYFNAIDSKINNGCLEEDLSKLESDHKVKWAEYVPELNVFSKESLGNGLKSEGFSILKSHGVPVFARPGLEDFDPENKGKSIISSSLEKTDFFKKVFDLEMKYNSQENLINRGMNIFTIAKK